MCFFNVDGLGRDGAPLFADDAIGSKGPRQTTAAIVECSAKADGLMLSAADSDNPALFLWRDLPDGSGGADFGAQDAARLAVAYARDQGRRPQSFEPGLRQGWMQRIVGADFHAFPATDAAGKEIWFVDGTGRSEEPVFPAFAKPCIGAHQGDGSRSASKAGQCTAATQIRRCNFVFLAEEAELKGVVWATAGAIHAHQAFRFAPRNSTDGVIAALAIQEAAVTLVALRGVLVQTKY